MKKSICRILFACLILILPASAQQVNQDVVPASTGLNIGHSNQRWNGFFRNLDISGTCTLNNHACFGGGTGSVTSITATGDGTVLSSTPTAPVTTSGTLNLTLANAPAGMVLNNMAGTSAQPIWTNSVVLGLNGGGGYSGELTLNGSTSGSTSLTVAPAAGTYTSRLPLTKGTVGQCLQSDGASPEQWQWGACGSGAPNQALPASPLINQGASTPPVYAAGITYATTAQNWSQTGITTSLTGGSASSLTLNAGFSGIDVTSGFGYDVYISDGGNSEAVHVTGGTYTFAGGGTITFTPFFNHGPGAYTVGSASSGIQETLNAVCGTSATFNSNAYCNVTVPATGLGPTNTYNVQGTIYFHAYQASLVGYGVVLNCTGRKACIQLGDLTSSNHFNDLTVEGFNFRSPTDFSAVPAYAGVAITNTVKTTQVVTITTATAHGFRIGDMVTILFTDNNAYWGDAVVTSVPTGTSFTYAHSGTDITTQATPGVVALAYSAILDNAGHSHISNITYDRGQENGHFNNFFDFWDDENATVDHFNNNGISLNQNINWTGSFFFSAGNQGSLNQIAPVITVRDSNITANGANCFTVYNSNGLYIENTVCQASGPWQVYSSNSTGNFQGASIKNIYSESSLNANPFGLVTGSVTSGVFQYGEQVIQGTTLASAYLQNAPTGSTSMKVTGVVGTPDNTHTWVGQTSTAVFTPTAVVSNQKSPYPGLGIAGLIAGPSASVANFSIAGQNTQGLFQSNCLGATSLSYFIVAHDVTASTVTSPMQVMTCLSTGSDLIPVQWPRIANGADTITYDVIRITTPSGVGGQYPFNGGCTGGSGGTCGSVATALSQATACGGTLVCSYQDTAAATTSAYTINTGTYAGNLPFWPGSLVTVTKSVYTSTDMGNTVGVGLGLSAAQITAQCQQFGGTGPGGHTQCQSSYHPALNSTANEAGMLLEDIGTGTPSVSKGRLNFINFSSGAHHIITLADSQPSLTKATAGFRPLAATTDVWIGTDGGAITTGQLAFGSPVSIANYIANTGGTGAGWLEKLTASAKTFAVPITINGATSGSVTLNASATGSVFNITATGGLQLNATQTLTGTQGTDSNIMTAGTVAGTGAPLCTDANGGATTSGCGGAVTTSGAVGGQGAFFTTATNITGMTDFLVNNGATHFVTVPAGGATQPGLVFASANNTGIRAVSGTLGLFAPNNATTDLTTIFERWNGSAYVTSVQITTGTGAPTVAATETGGVLNILGNLGTTSGNGSVVLNPQSQAPTATTAAGTWVKGTFNPASGNANYFPFYINPTINQTSTASGGVNALVIAPFNQGLLGTENLILAGTASAQTTTATITPKFTVDSSGNVVSQGSVTATTSVKGATYLTATNCAAVGSVANPSVVSCSSAAAGLFYCDVTASAGTCTLNTTAITGTGSQVFVRLTGQVPPASGVTCNTAPTAVPAIYEASWSAGTATINMPTGTVNGFCFEYEVKN